MALETPLWLENIGQEYNAREFRHMLRALCEDTNGVMRVGDLAVTQRSAGANMSVDVAAGDAYIVGTEGGVSQGAYMAFNNATANVGPITADGSNPRRVIVGVRVQDEEYSGSANTASLVAVHGTPASSPSDPTLPDNFLSLARISVAAGATSITNAVITNMRNLAAPSRNARGRITQQEFGTDTGNFTSLTTVNGSAVGINMAEAGRRLRLDASLQWRSSTVGDSIVVRFRLDGGVIGEPWISEPKQVTATDATWFVTTNCSPSAGAHIIDMTVDRSAAPGGASSLPRIQGANSFIRIYDEGGRIA